MLLERKSLNHLIFKLLLESFYDEETTEEIIRLFDPERELKIKKAKESGNDYVLQNMDGIDPLAMDPEERIRYIKHQADILTQRMIDSAKRKSEKEKQEVLRQAEEIKARYASNDSGEVSKTLPPTFKRNTVSDYEMMGDSEFTMWDEEDTTKETLDLKSEEE
jgi:hypothetical protein